MSTREVEEEKGKRGERNGSECKREKGKGQGPPGVRQTSAAGTAQRMESSSDEKTSVKPSAFMKSTNCDETQEAEVGGRRGEGGNGRAKCEGDVSINE